MAAKRSFELFNVNNIGYNGIDWLYYGAETVFKALITSRGPNDLIYRRGVGFDLHPRPLVDSVLYAGAHSSVYGVGNFALNTLIGLIPNDSINLYFNGVSYAVNKVMWGLAEASFNLELKAAKTMMLSNDTKFFPIFSKIPARKASATKQQAAANQYFQFFFRSLKPSIWKNDNTLKQLNDKAPKGILQMPSSITNFSENYNSNWSQQNILGNVQKIHKYQYTDRSISLTVDLYSHSLAELRYNIWRLNWLSNHTYGKLSSNERLEPEVENNLSFVQSIDYKELPFIRATIGSVINELPCYINTLSITYHMDKPWVLGDDWTNREKGSKELQYPHLITVTMQLNVLYDELDPTDSAFYTQDGSLERGDSISKELKYIEW